LSNHFSRADSIKGAFSEWQFNAERPALRDLESRLDCRRKLNEFVSLHPLPSELTPSNIREELKFYEMVGAIPAPELLKFASANFYRLSEVFVHQLKPQTLDLIFSESLVLESDDGFFDFITGEVGGGCLDLLRHVDLVCLSGEKIREFLSLLDITTLTQGIWDRIQRTLQSVLPDPLHQSCSHSYLIVFNSGRNYFDGVFACLNRWFGGNCARNGVIKVTGTQNCCNEPTVLFAGSDWGGSNFWHPRNDSNVWIRADFKGRRVSITHYAIHNCLPRCGEAEILKTWAMEGSNAGSDSDSDWTVIDARSDDESLHGKDKVQALFECRSETVHAFRYIRLIQRGPCHNTSNRGFVISQFELFGAVSLSQ
jgi:hypothetical protein